MRKKSSSFVSGETTVIGAGTTIEGNMNVESSARIEGEVSGDVIAKGTIIVGEGGVIKGHITAADVTIAGTVNGNVNASGRTELVAKGCLIGDISTNRLIVDEEATFQGKCMMKTETLTEQPADKEE